MEMEELFFLGLLNFSINQTRMTAGDTYDSKIPHRLFILCRVMNYSPWTSSCLEEVYCEGFLSFSSASSQGPWAPSKVSG